MKSVVCACKMLAILSQDTYSSHWELLQAMLQSCAQYMQQSYIFVLSLHVHAKRSIFCLAIHPDKAILRQSVGGGQVLKIVLKVVHVHRAAE